MKACTPFYVSQLEGYERSTGHQLIVYIGQTTGDAPIDDWAVRAFEKWKVGRKSIDDGLVLFIMAAEPRWALVSFGAWLSLAYLVTRVTDVAIWDPIARRVPVPRLLRDVTGVLVYSLALGMSVTHKNIFFPNSYAAINDPAVLQVIIGERVKNMVARPEEARAMSSTVGCRGGGENEHHAK